MRPLDRTIRNRVRRRLEEDPRTSGLAIDVRVEKGEVHLTGGVDSHLAADAARLLAAEVDGVRGVTSLLTVAATPPASADTELRQEAMAALQRDPQIGASEISIEVQGGNLIVRGAVDRDWKKLKAIELVGGIEGVAAVIDELTVVPTDVPEDEIIARSIMDAAERIAPSTVDTIEVRVEDGMVTLSGQVPTWMDKDALYAAALDTDGVVEVEDNLIIKTTIG